MLTEELIDMSFDYDYLIIGSGFGGAAYAWRFVDQRFALHLMLGI